MKTNKTLFYVTLILLECLLWGVSNPMMKIGFTVLTPLFCQSARFVLAFLLFLPFFWKRILAPSLPVRAIK
jgi:drug/metabolite transporter (DMT)-like permease